jgi:hypothetical protein
MRFIQVRKYVLVALKSQRSKMYWCHSNLNVYIYCYLYLLKAQPNSATTSRHITRKSSTIGSCDVRQSSTIGSCDVRLRLRGGPTTAHVEPIGSLHDFEGECHYHLSLLVFGGHAVNGSKQH